MLNIGMHNMKIGDTARFPLGRLGGNEPPYNRTWAIHAFTPSGIVVRRRHDGVERVVSSTWFEHYRLEEDRPGPYAGSSRETLDARRAVLRDRRLADARAALQAEEGQPGYYVSARKGPQHVLLLGPFRDHYTALQVVRDAWPIVRRYDDPWGEISVGTCKVDTSSKRGKFNQEVLGHA